MPFFDAIFNKYGNLFLWIGSTGTGIKIYIRDGGVLEITVQSTDSGSTKPKVSYKSKFNEDNLTLVGSSTSDDTIKNILLQRLYPHYHKTHNYSKDQLFQGSPAFTLNGKDYQTNNSKKLYILDKNENTDISAFKTSCETALETEYTSTTTDGKTTHSAEYYRLKEWCTVSKIKLVLTRHKLTVLITDEDKNTDDDKWKDVISGGWFNDTYKSQQTFLDSGTFLGSGSGISNKANVTDDQVKQIKKKCKEVLDKDFVRDVFPAPKSFIDVASDKSKFTKVDEFQEAALFCVEAKKAEDYVKEAMQGVLRTTLPTTDNDMKDDFCLIDGKTLDDYKSVKTNDPFDGKSFWCAVRILYEKHKDN